MLGLRSLWQWAREQITTGRLKSAKTSWTFSVPLFSTYLYYLYIVCWDCWFAFFFSPLQSLSIILSQFRSDWSRSFGAYYWTRLKETEQVWKGLKSIENDLEYKLTPYNGCSSKIRDTVKKHNFLYFQRIMCDSVHIDIESERNFIIDFK